MSNAYYITAKDLADLSKDNIPKELVSSSNLVYSSPATLAFNSPGATGFGVKRAGLVVPDSVMLLVSPACCGRNTAALNELGYRERFFYLMLDDTDIVTGRHLTKIPKAVCEICQSLDKKPSCVMICITCVDALLGTDMELVCRKCSKEADLPVVPCYMYALTREGRLPPMSHVRGSVYSLLKPTKRKSNAMNILGFFAPLINDCELYGFLKSAGIKTIKEISRCRNFDEYLEMSSANFNLVLNSEARYAAQQLEEKLKIPYIELTRMYQIEKIKNQYTLFSKAIGVEFDQTEVYEETLNIIENFKKKFSDLTFAIGESANCDPFELSLALLTYGFKVSEIYGTVTPTNFSFINKIAKLSENTKIYSNLSPTMLFYNEKDFKADIVIGKDAMYYHPSCKGIGFNTEIQPFGYKGLQLLFKTLTKELEKEQNQ